jgi:ankyrin repeat protein
MSARSPRGSLPAHAHPDWYRRAAKQRLVERRASDPRAKLWNAQLDVARAHGFSSWRGLIAAIREQRAAHAAASSSPSPHGKTPLHEAATADDASAIEVLLEQGADIEARYGEAGHTPLSWAITVGAFRAARALVAGGARTDLYCAAALGDVAVVRSFFNRDGALTNDPSHTCRVRFLSLATRSARRPHSRDLVTDAAYAAVRHSRVEAARFLLDRGVDVRAPAFFGATLLHWACYGGSRAIIDMLIAAGADKGERDETFDCTPRAFGICAPARLGLVSLVAERLHEDSSLAAINEGRGTPLHEAARAGNEEIARLLLAHGADPQARDASGRTPADVAGGAVATWSEVLL